MSSPWRIIGGTHSRIHPRRGRCTRSDRRLGKRRPSSDVHLAVAFAAARALTGSGLGGVATGAAGDLSGVDDLDDLAEVHGGVSESLRLAAAAVTGRLATEVGDDVAVDQLD